MAGADTIVFAIPGTGQKTITLLSLLPSITETITIDGGNNGNASDRVELTGDALATGLDVQGAGSNDSAIRNLVINGFTSRQILGLFTNNLVVQNCYLNLNAAGTEIVRGQHGVEFDVGSGALIGGTSPGTGNVISSALSSGDHCQPGQCDHSRQPHRPQRQRHRARGRPAIRGDCQRVGHDRRRRPGSA